MPVSKKTSISSTRQEKITRQIQIEMQFSVGRTAMFCSSICPTKKHVFAQRSQSKNTPFACVLRNESQNWRESPSQQVFENFLKTNPTPYMHRIPRLSPLLVETLPHILASWSDFCLLGNWQCVSDVKVISPTWKPEETQELHTDVKIPHYSEQRRSVSLPQKSPTFPPESSWPMSRRRKINNQKTGHVCILYVLNRGNKRAVGSGSSSTCLFGTGITLSVLFTHRCASLLEGRHAFTRFFSCKNFHTPPQRYRLKTVECQPVL